MLLAKPAKTRRMSLDTLQSKIQHFFIQERCEIKASELVVVSVSGLFNNFFLTDTAKLARGPAQIPFVTFHSYPASPYCKKSSLLQETVPYSNEGHDVRTRLKDHSSKYANQIITLATCIACFHRDSGMRTLAHSVSECCAAGGAHIPTRRVKHTEEMRDLRDRHIDFIFRSRGSGIVLAALDIGAFDETNFAINIKV